MENGLPCFAGSAGPYKNIFFKWTQREYRRQRLATNPLDGVADVGRAMEDIDATTGLKYQFEVACYEEQEKKSNLWINADFQKMIDEDQALQDRAHAIMMNYYYHEIRRLKR